MASRHCLQRLANRLKCKEMVVDLGAAVVVVAATVAN